MIAVIQNLRIVDEYPSGAADSASQLKRKYLLALRPRPLGPLDWGLDWTVTGLEHGWVCCERSPGLKAAALLVLRLTGDSL